MTTAYNAELFDAELTVERAGRAFFDRYALADLLGISVKSINELKARGRIPAPSHYRGPDGRCSSVRGGHMRAAWTPLQAARILAERRARGLSNEPR